jgi:palmitoyltransferase
MLNFKELWQRYFPRETSDKIAFCFINIFLTYVSFFELFLVFPTVFHEWNFNYVLNVGFGALLYINMMSSLYQLIFNPSNTNNLALPTVLKTGIGHRGWKYCANCGRNAPPRSQHCFLCNCCILRRDHHCAFSGNCVGFLNHRYYFLLVFYAMVASMYSSFINFDYTWDVMDGLNWQSFFTMLLPFIAYILGIATHYSFVVAFTSSVIMMSFLLMTSLFVYNTQMIFRGQTAFEKSMKIKDFDVGREDNIKQVMGKNWKYAWISPFIPSPPCGDGMAYPTKFVEDVKNM